MCTLGSGIAVHSYIGIQMWISWTLGLQSIAQISTNKHDSGLVPDSSFSESKARCRLGHETRNRGATSSGANYPAILAFLQKGGRGKKIFHFCDFFAEPIFA